MKNHMLIGDGGTPTPPKNTEPGETDDDGGTPTPPKD